MRSIIKLVQKIRSSFTLQLTIWVGGGVLLISAVVIFLLAQFSQQVIRDESVEITQQALANMALRIDNELRQADISARLEHRTFTIDRLMIEKMIEENNQLTAIKQSLPQAQIYVAESKATREDGSSVQEDQQKQEGRDQKDQQRRLSLIDHGAHGHSSSFYSRNGAAVQEQPRVVRWVEG